MESETEGRETVKGVRSFTLTNSALGTHHSMTVPSPKTQEKNHAQIRRLETGYASTPTLCLVRGKERTLLRQHPNSAGPAWAEPGWSRRPLLAFSLCSSFSAVSAAPALPASRPPPRLPRRQGAEPGCRDFWAPAVGQSCLWAQRRCSRGPDLYSFTAYFHITVQVAGIWQFGSFLFCWNSV